MSRGKGGSEGRKNKREATNRSDLAEQPPFPLGRLGRRLQVDQVLGDARDARDRVGADAVLPGVVLLEPPVPRDVLGREVPPEGRRVRPERRHSCGVVLIVFHCGKPGDAVVPDGASRCGPDVTAERDVPSKFRIATECGSRWEGRQRVRSARAEALPSSAASGPSRVPWGDLTDQRAQLKGPTRLGRCGVERSPYCSDGFAGRRAKTDGKWTVPAANLTVARDTIAGSAGEPLRLWLKLPQLGQLDSSVAE